MDKEKIINMIKAFCSCDGTSGDENAIAGLIKIYFPSAQTDALGNIICNINPEGKKRVLLEAHMDRVGFVVCEIDDGGFLHLAKVGGPDLRTTVGTSVTVQTDNGVLFGVVCSTPPHLKKDSDSKNVSINDLAVDIGMGKAEAEKAVSIGDRVLVNDVFTELQSDNVSCACLDDRAGCVAVVLAAEKLTDKLKDVNLVLAFNTREEVGGSGAKVTSFAVEPEYCISVDAGFGEDYHCTGDEAIALCKGPSIGVAPILDFVMMKKLKALAKENNIPYQHDVMSRTTGTDADSIHNTKCGVKCALLSIPVCNMHTQVEIANVEDIENTAELMKEFVLSLEGENA